MNTVTNDILTPDQAAEYLQVNRETIYRYIRDGRLMAARLGRNYRISRRSLETLLLANRARPDIPLREYSDEELAGFLSRDKLDDETSAVIRDFEARIQANAAHGH